MDDDKVKSTMIQSRVTTDLRGQIWDLARKYRMNESAIIRKALELGLQYLQQDTNISYTNVLQQNLARLDKVFLEISDIKKDMKW